MGSNGRLHIDNNSTEAYSRYTRSRYERTTSDETLNQRGASHGSAQSAIERARKERRRRKKIRRIVISLVTVVAVVAGGAFAYAQYINGNLHFGIDQGLRDSLVKTDLAHEPFYMLLMGTDGSQDRENSVEYAGDQFRTDSIILTRIDPVEKKVSMVSIHRDTMVDLGDEYGIQKINAAHALGGPALSVQTVSEMAGVGISHYAEINFDGFKNIVDTLGGVEVDVPVTIDDADAGGHVDAGLQTLNGDQALILCRSRNTYGDTVNPDMMRAANQRLVLSAIANKILTSDIATIANTVSTLSQYVITDLDVQDIIGLAQVMQGLNPEKDIYTAMQPATAKYIDDIWYMITDERKWRAMIDRMNRGLPPAEEALVDESTGTVLATTGEAVDTTATKKALIDVKNGSGITGVGNEAAARLNEAGFVNVITGNANSFDYEKTLIIYDDVNEEYEANLVVEALGQGETMLNDGNYLYDGDILVLIGSDWYKTDSEN